MGYEDDQDEIEDSARETAALEAEIATLKSQLAWTEREHAELEHELSRLPEAEGEDDAGAEARVSFVLGELERITGERADADAARIELAARVTDRTKELRETEQELTCLRDQLDRRPCEFCSDAGGSSNVCTSCKEQMEGDLTVAQGELADSKALCERWAIGMGLADERERWRERVVRELQRRKDVAVDEGESEDASSAVWAIAVVRALPDEDSAELDPNSPEARRIANEEYPDD